MQTAEQINRNQSDPDALDFETLRKDALTIIQNLCGDNWTDYNLHDPGVTILEQLCYALTDLSYRSEFPVADYLTGRDGSIDYVRQSLFPPYEIFPSSAVTENDFEKVLYDAVPEIDRIWFKPAQYEQEPISGLTGLYTVYVKIDPAILQVRSEGAVQQTLKKLEPIIEQITRLKVSVMHWHSLTNQIGIGLQTRLNLLKRLCKRLSRTGDTFHRGQSESIKGYLVQSGELLLRLETQLTSCLVIHEELGLVHGLLYRQVFSPEGIKQLDLQLSALQKYFEAPLPRLEYEQIYAILDMPLNKPDDLISVMQNVLPRLTVTLAETERILCDVTNCLKKVQNDIKGFFEAGVMKKIHAVYCAQRSLCEDIHTIRMVETKPFFLTGEIEVRPQQHPAKIYAEIFFRCSRYISSNIQIEHYGDVLTSNEHYESIFSGPLTHHGYIRDASMTIPRNIITVVDLMTCIREISGVVQIRNLGLSDEAGNQLTDLNDQLSQHVFPVLYYSHANVNNQIMNLALPHDETAGQLASASTFNTAVHWKDTVFFDEFQRELKKLVFEYQAFRRNAQSVKQFVPQPNGRSRPLSHYYSIQHQFPAIYGINKEGVPRSQPADVHAKAKQLKAYLFPFEQLMANYLEGLQQIPVLFSPDQRVPKTYFPQFLDNSKVPDIEPLYTGKTVTGDVSLSTIINDIQSQYDDPIERKNRILDILLALYGEVYEHQQLLRFNYYRREDSFSWILELKISYLKSIAFISKDRCDGFDYSHSDSKDYTTEVLEKSSALHVKIGLLLGLQLAKSPAWVSDILVDRKSRLVADQIMADKIKSVSDTGKSEVVPDKTNDNSEKLFGTTLPSQLPIFSYSIFKEGIQLENYRLLRLEQGRTAVCFKSGHDARLWILTKEPSFEEAVIYAHRFCNTMRVLNRQCENFHIIEHILLRPRENQSFTRPGVDATFFNCRVSVVLPSWTACFSDTAFRCFAEEIIQQNLPAHVFADFYWLNFLNMRSFEEYYKIWLQCLQQYSRDQDDEILSRLNQASDSLIAFLLKYKQEKDGDYWL